MSGLPAPITGITGSILCVVVVVVAVVVVGHLVLWKLGPTILCCMALPVASSAHHLSAFPVVMVVTFITLGKIPCVLFWSIWRG